MNKWLHSKTPLQCRCNMKSITYYITSGFLKLEFVTELMKSL